MNPDLSPDDFAAFFAAIHGVPPFPWQHRLLRLLAETGTWPSVLDLPTGSGKTAALDIALFHLALEAGKGADRRAPVRIAFVVDRRLIVDDAFERAKRICGGIAWSLLDGQSARTLEGRLAEKGELDQINLLHRVRAEPLVRHAASRLGRFAERPERPVLARRLRGGVPREDDWARTPSQPTILCSTVDQVGSRLLFRGYGISDRMKPVHAGLLGSDCLILLDEAHLAEPFRQTLQALRRLRRPDPAPWQSAVLTATPGLPGEFLLDDRDRSHPTLSQRLEASKPAKLDQIANRQGIAPEDRRVAEIVERTAQMLAGLRKSIPNPAIGVVVNRVARARRAFGELKSALSDNATVVLVIGPARAAERERKTSEALASIRTGANRDRDRPLIVVATQTIEAGVDIDFDGLVTEAAPLDALRQRFGRLNRAGRPIASSALVLAHKEDIGTRADDPVYGDRIARTWETLTAAAGSDGGVDFGIDAFPRELTDNTASLGTTKACAPVLMPAYAHLWSQTSPLPNADPEPALFLHGPERKPASVQIVWRADVTAQSLSDRQHVLQILRALPPRSGEAIEIPLWAARSWLRQHYDTLEDLSDVAGSEPEEPRAARVRRVFRYGDPRDEQRTRAVLPDELRDGDVIVAPAEYGGCDEWGWAPESGESVRDIAEMAARPYASRRFAVRVTAELLHDELAREAPPETSGAVPDVDRLRHQLKELLAEADERKAPELLETVLASGFLSNERRDWLEHIKVGRRHPTCHLIENDSGEPEGVIFIAPFGITTASEDETLAAPASTEDDETGSLTGSQLTLLQHSEHVRGKAEAFAANAGLDPGVAKDVTLAAYLHDAGKADPRFQAMLYGGNWFAVVEQRLLAKSVPGVGPEAASKAGLPDRWRHEALSVRIAREHPRFREANDPELVLWLIGVHHGYGRPFFPHADSEDASERDLVHIDGSKLHLKAGAGPQSLAFDFKGSDWCQIFERLKRRYGIWGLARLEAIVRLADHRASEGAADRAVAESR